MAKSKKISIARRNFLKGAAGSAAALAASPQAIKAQQAEPPRYAAARPAPAEIDPAPNVEVLTADRPGSDFMVDILKSLGFEFVFANPRSSFRGLQESVTVYGGNKNPEFITCCHERIFCRHGSWVCQDRGQAHLCFCTRYGWIAACGVLTSVAERMRIILLLDERNFVSVRSRNSWEPFRRPSRVGSNATKRMGCWAWREPIPDGRRS